MLGLYDAKDVLLVKSKLFWWSTELTFTAVLAD